MSDSLTAREMTKAIEKHLMAKYQQQGHWAILREVTIADIEALDGLNVASKSRHRVATAARAAGAVLTRRIDLLLINLRKSKSVRVPNERICLEIKVSRADFKKDTELKRRAWFNHAHRFAYVTPKGMVTKDEVPEGCGLLEYDPDKPVPSMAFTWKVTAPYRDVEPRPFDMNFFVYLVNRLSVAEQKLRPRERIYA